MALLGGPELQVGSRSASQGSSSVDQQAGLHFQSSGDGTREQAETAIYS